jgi:hypothetical protein
MRRDFSTECGSSIPVRALIALIVQTGGRWAKWSNIPVVSISADSLSVDNGGIPILSLDNVHKVPYLAIKWESWWAKSHLNLSLLEGS